ncbi:MAG TPA: DUF2161 family putative PD-(D/E)XK-type phosphodiesterase [Patescibacteria group bacterium]|nr:DUF2161 family putative PD-(D/E)XK-type phosphodiesterase [Patescibacteria group bacterium]
MKNIRETDLYPPVRDYLIGLGYTVRGEVKDCDMIAVRDDELLAVELKRSFNVTLLMQATRRQKATDTVYIAIPRPARGPRSESWRGMLHLLRRLELGLIIVSFAGGAARVEVALHPEPLERRRDYRLKRSILREMHGRSGDYNVGGSHCRKVMTAYKENAIQIACGLELLGPSAPAQLRERGTGLKTGELLRKNFYGWFERLERGVYGLSEEGRAALIEHQPLADHYRQQLMTDV